MNTVAKNSQMEDFGFVQAHTEALEHISRSGIHGWIMVVSITY